MPLLTSVGTVSLALRNELANSSPVYLGKKNNGKNGEEIHFFKGACGWEGEYCHEEQVLRQTLMVSVQFSSI